MADQGPGSAAELGTLITRTVRHVYRGHPMTVALSQSLFSSADVDRGSRRLLKFLASVSAQWGENPSVLDLGCGVGVLGLALALAGARVLFRDRDALALEVARHNCRVNGIRPEGVEGALGMTGLGSRRFDLIVSNLPAKAGRPVHEAMLPDAARHLAPSGRLAVVVVAPLVPRIRDAMDQAGLRVRVADQSPGHAVLCGEPERPVPPEDPDPLGPYHRGTVRFRHSGIEYALQTRYGLPEFDKPSYDTALALEALAERQPVLPAGPILVWNPGQGHVPAWLAARARSAGAHSQPAMVLGGRDLLALQTSRHAAGDCVRDAVHAWDPAQTAGRYACVVLFPDDDPAARWEERLGPVAARLLSPTGRLVLSASSTFVERLLRRSGLHPEWSRKRAGRRCVVLGVP